MPSGNPKIAEAGKNTRWKPGQTGNPEGPKPGYKHINTWVQELLHDDDFTAWISDPREGYKEFKGAPIKAIVQAQMTKALAGDTKAYDSLVKSGWAMKIENDITTNGENVNQVDANMLTQFLQAIQQDTKR